MFQSNKLNDYEVECLALRLQGDFIRRKMAIYGDGRIAHRYGSHTYLDVFRAAVKSHHPRHVNKIMDGAFAAFADPQPEDLVGEEAVKRTMSAPSRHKSDITELADDPDVTAARLEKEAEWLRASMSYGEYRGQAIIRFLAIRRLDDSTVPVSAVHAMAREALLEAKIDPGIVDDIDGNLANDDVPGLLEEAAELLVEIDEAG